MYAIRSYYVIQRQIIMCLALELLELPLVVSLDPARRCDVNRLEPALHFVFVLEAMGNNIELQRPDRT